MQTKIWNRFGVLTCKVFCVGICVCGLFALSQRWNFSLADDEAEPKSTKVSVEPQAEFSITVSDNPSTGYTMALSYMSEGIFLIRTEDKKLPPNSPPGAAGGRTFKFYQWHSKSEAPLEIIFSRFRPFDLENTYSEEKYVLEIKEKSSPKKRLTPQEQDPAKPKP